MFLTKIIFVLARVCSKHFNENTYKRDFKAELMGTEAKRLLKDCAIPTENLPKLLILPKQQSKELNE